MRDAACANTRPAKLATEKYMPKKWKELTTTQYSKLTGVEKSRYDAVRFKMCAICVTCLMYQYEPPPKHIEELQAAALKRIRQVKQEEKE